jgi:hypothetical protein
MMMRIRGVVWLLFVGSLFRFDSRALAEDPGSLLGTIINEAVRQSQGGDARQEYGRYGDNDYYDDRYYDARQGRRVTCESQGGRYNYCRTDVRGRVRLDRQLSDTPCRQYDTWGVDGDGGGIWVSNGCRAVFSVDDRGYPSYGGGGWQEGRKTIVCKSDGYKYNYCRTGTRGDVRLERKLSDAPCREYETWGADRDGGGVWVDQGCSGEFSIR